MNIHIEVQRKLKAVGMTLTEVVGKLNEQPGEKPMSYEVLLEKLTKETLTYREAHRIALALGKRITWTNADEILKRVLLHLPMVDGEDIRTATRRATDILEFLFYGQEVTVDYVLAGEDSVWDVWFKVVTNVPEIEAALAGSSYTIVEGGGEE